jgi:hypothetical protein
MIARWIDLCARNRFLVFTGTLLLVLAGIWAERQMPMDALPDISDAQVIIHTAWYEPPNVIEDQVTYPIVTALLAAPSVKAVRAQTMFGDSYVLVLEGVAALGSQFWPFSGRRVPRLDLAWRVDDFGRRSAVAARREAVTDDAGDRPPSTPEWHSRPPRPGSSA